MKLLKIPSANETFVSIDEIVRVEALSNYSRIYLRGGKKLVVSKVLHWFEKELPIEMFARVHRSHLVNKLFVQQINGVHSKTLLLYNGETVTIIRRKRLAAWEQLTQKGS